MATELDRLFVTLEADLTNYQAGLKRAGADLDTFTRDAERKSTAAGKAIEAGLSAANANARLTGQQVQQLGYQLNDIATSLASGISPFQTLAQQGGQVYQALSMNGGVAQGLAGVKTGIAENVTASRLLAGGFAAAAAAAVYLGVSYVSAQDDIKKGLSGIGAASGATVKDINSIAERISAAKSISISAARDIATAIAATGKVNVSNIEGVAGLTPGYARIFGLDLDAASAQLATMFSDPVRGADEFIKKLGGINDQTRQLIQNLTEQGKRQQAINELRSAVQPMIDAAQDSRSPTRRIIDTVTTRGGQALDTVARAAAATVSPEGTVEDQLRTAQRDLAIARKVKDTVPGLFGGDNSLANIALEALERKVADLNRQLEETATKNRKAFDAQQAGELSIAAGNIIRALDPEGQAIEKLQNQMEALGRSLAAAALNGSEVKIDGGIENAIAKYGALSTKVDTLSQAYKVGGVAAKNALDAANFQSQTAGLSSYERGLRGIIQQYEQMAKSAEQAGNSTAAATYRGAARDAAVGAFQTSNRENVIRNTPLGSGEVASTIGAESGGSNIARNPRSSALGAGQFIEATFVSLFRKYDSEQAAVIDEANPIRAEADKVIAGMRTNRQITEKYVEIYLKEIGASLTEAGLPSTPQNRQLGYFLGPEGAKTLLQADPSANAAGLLPKAAAANPEVFRGGAASVQDVLNYASKRVAANSAEAQSSREKVIAYRAEAESIGLSAAQQERQRAVQEALDAARTRGEEIGTRFKTAQDLIRASSASLTPELQAQRTAILEVADARAKASSNVLSTRFDQDQSQARAALGRTYEEQAAYQGARAYGATPGSDEFARYYDGLREIQGLTEAKNSTGSFLKDLNYDLMRGASLSEALGNALSRLSTRLADKALDSLVSGLFGGGSGSPIFSAVGSFLGLGGGGGSPTGSVRLFSDGGFTGAGGKYTPAGVVHAGEYVFDQESVKRIGLPALDSLRRNLRGFAQGGFVGAMPSIPAAVPAGGGGAAPSINFITPPGVALEPAGPPKRRADGGFDQILRSVESGLGQRASRGQGPFRGVGGAGYRSG
ncbi:phage-related minor tail protein [Methylorubrum extorquens]